MAVALAALAACDKEPGPEYTTPAGFGAVVFKPEPVTSQDAVHVTVPITSTYGLGQAQIVYALGDAAESARSTQPIPYLKTTTATTFAGTIPKQAAGTKVTFRVVAYTAYGVVSWSDVCQYTVTADTPAEE